MCVVGAINNYTDQLYTYGDSPKSSYNLTESLMFLAHFVGDVHQPLHVGYEEDEGGNTIMVRWYRRKANLHHVWDVSIIDTVMKDFYNKSLDTMVGALQTNLTPRGHIYSSIKTNFKYKTRQDQILVYYILSNNPYTQYPPAVTTVARQTIRLEKNLKGKNHGTAALRPDGMTQQQPVAQLMEVHAEFGTVFTTPAKARHQRTRIPDRIKATTVSAYRQADGGVDSGRSGPQRSTQGLYAIESIHLSCNYAYKDVVQNITLGDDYYFTRYPVVEKRLAQAGVRLALILNRIFDKKKADTMPLYVQ
ncbi:Nuclease S1 [Triticum urartu]|uniref:Aspergillus nuclease S1 n=1 Tax=Triticum urartu TaxID=4572 RepID=M7Y8Z5_TRIUA|nr:Nuclease S1 [Triticum urartu]